MSTNRDIFDATGGWTFVHHTPDDWEASLIKAALAREEIPSKLDENKSQNGRTLIGIAVPVEAEDAAMEVLMRVVEVVRRPPKSPSVENSDEKPVVEVRAIPTDVARRQIAAREGTGEIVHIEGHGFELRVGPQPYAFVTEDRWEEFTDFSAQRQEFSILLEKEYEPLYRWLRAQKKFGDFLHLVESTYRGTPEEDAPEQFLRAAGWMLAVIVGIAALVAVSRWLEGLTLGTAG